MPAKKDPNRGYGPYQSPSSGGFVKRSRSSFDGIVKSQKSQRFVILAKAGIQ